MFSVFLTFHLTVGETVKLSDECVACTNFIKAPLTKSNKHDKQEQQQYLCKDLYKYPESPSLFREQAILKNEFFHLILNSLSLEPL